MPAPNRHNGYDLKLANEVLTEQVRPDPVRQAFIANPDLVERFKRGAPLNTPDTATFYGGGAKGYIDYPALAPEPAAS